MNYALPTSTGSLQELFYGENPSLAYDKYWKDQNVNSFSPFGRFVGSQQGRSYADFQHDLFNNNRPLGYSYSEYLGQNGQNMRSLFAGLPASQRGVSHGAYSPRVRWLNL
jgi:hypothetical protein